MGLESSSMRANSSIGLIEPVTIRACVLCCTNRRDLTDIDIQSKPLSNSTRTALSSKGHPFLDAVACGDLEDVRMQLLVDPSLAKSAHDSKGNSAAHIAAFLGHLNLLQFLVETEPELLSATNEVRNTPIHRAAEAGKVPIIAYIRDKEPALLSCKGAMGASPMHLAAAKVSRAAPPAPRGHPFHFLFVPDPRKPPLPQHSAAETSRPPLGAGLRMNRASDQREHRGLSQGRQSHGRPPAPTSTSLGQRTSARTPSMPSCAPLQCIASPLHCITAPPYSALRRPPAVYYGAPLQCIMALPTVYYGALLQCTAALPYSILRRSLQSTTVLPTVYCGAPYSVLRRPQQCISASITGPAGRAPVKRPPPPHPPRPPPPPPQGHLAAVSLLAEASPGLLALRDRRGATAAHYAARQASLSLAPLYVSYVFYIL